MPDVQALLLDMDGVIIDSEPLHEEAQRIVFRDHALPVPESEFPSFKGMSEENVFRRLLRQYGNNGHRLEDLIRAKEEAYRALLPVLEPVPGSLAFIRRVHGRFRLGLTTSAVRIDQMNAFEKFELDAYFEAVVTAEDIRNPKPHPEPYLATAALLGVDPEQCLVVEDSLHGVTSALAAGCRVAGITTSFNAEQLSQAGAHVAVETFDQLSEYLAVA